MGETNTNANITTDNNTTENKVVLTQAEYDRAIQSAEDKIRTRYYSEEKPKLVEEIENLKSRVAELSQYEPKQKSEAEIALEKREADIAAKEQAYAWRDKLTESGVDKGFWDYLKSDADLEGFNKVLSEAYKTNFQSQIAEKGFVPKAPIGAGSTISKEDFRRMGALERENLFKTEPELYKQLIKQ